MESAAEPFEPSAYAINLPLNLQRVMAAGALAIALGVMGLCTLPLLAEPVTSEYLGRGGVLVDHGAINTWGMVSSNTGCLLSCVALLGGMGCLRFRRWARPTLLAYCVASILLGITGVYFHLLILRAAGSDAGLSSYATRVGALFEWLAWAVGTVFSAWALWVLTRPGVKAAFARGSAV